MTSRWRRSSDRSNSAARSSTRRSPTATARASSCSAQVLARHRDKPLIVATKMPPKNLKWPALPEYALDDVFPADHIRRSRPKSACENLGVETIDLQQFHVWTDAWADDERWQRAVDDLKRERTHPRLRHQRQSLGAGQRASGARAPASSTACRSSTTCSIRIPRTSCSRVPRAGRRGDRARAVRRRQPDRHDDAAT